MKKSIVFILSLLLVLTGCNTKNSPSGGDGSVSSQLSDRVGNSSAASSSQESKPATAAYDNKFYENVLLTFGGVLSEDLHGRPCMKKTKSGSLYDENLSWDDAETIENKYYFSWVVNSAVQDPKETIDAKNEKYKSPHGEGSGWFFPQDMYEERVQKYFDVSTEHLRSNDRFYDAEFKGYSLGGGGGFGDTPIIILDKTEVKGDLHKLYVTLKSQFNLPTIKAVLTVKATDNANFKYISYKITDTVPDPYPNFENTVGKVIALGDKRLAFSKEPVLGTKEQLAA